MAPDRRQPQNLKEGDYETFNLDFAPRFIRRIDCL